MIEAELPTHEIDLLTNTVDEALGLAHEGQGYLGYLELLYGLERARLQVADGEWGPELVLRWVQALKAYAREDLPRN